MAEVESAGEVIYPADPPEKKVKKIGKAAGA